MPTRIMANDIPNSMHPDLYDAAIREALRRTTDDCQVWVVKLDDQFGVKVAIASRKGNWSRTFLGLEVRPDNIRRTVEDATSCLIGAEASGQAAKGDKDAAG